MRHSATRLPPAEWFPAGWPGITARRVELGDGTSLRVVEAGPGDGAKVLLLHGWGVSAYLWRHTLTGLAEAGYRAIAADLPGHGLSDAPAAKGDYTVDAFARRCALLMDTLDMARGFVVGQSLGGRVATELALRARAERLVLFGPVGFGSVTPATQFAPYLPDIPGEIGAALVTRQMVEVVQTRVHGKLGWFTPRDVDEYWAPTQFPAVVHAQIQMLREFSFDPLTDAQLASIDVPTLVVFGTGDKTVKPAKTAEIAAKLPNGRLEWIEGGGHVVMEEIPERINALLVEFLGAAR